MLNDWMNRMICSTLAGPVPSFTEKAITVMISSCFHKLCSIFAIVAFKCEIATESYNFYFHLYQES